MPSSQLFPVGGERSICFLPCTSQISCEKYFENTKRRKALNANGSPWSQRLITQGGSVHTAIKTHSPQTCRRRSCCPSHQLVPLFSVPAGSPAHFLPPPFKTQNQDEVPGCYPWRWMLVVNVNPPPFCRKAEPKKPKSFKNINPSHHYSHSVQFLIYLNTFHKQ